MIFADQTVLAQCPPGCAADLPADNTVVHFSAEQVIVTDHDGETHRIYVSRQLVDRPGAEPAIRLMGAADAPMSPQQALQLIAALYFETMTAMSSWQMTR